MATSPERTDVLVVGAGPTGLMLALELAVHKVKFRIIEKTSVPSDKSRAIVLQPRSLELLRRHGIVDSFLKHGTQGTGVQIFVHKQRAVKIDLEDLGLDGTAFTLPLWISQADTEAFMAAHLSSTYGIEVERGFTAEDIQQDETGVDVTLRRTDDNGGGGGGGSADTLLLRASYVVGCDGAHSAVRRAAGLTFEGAPYPQDFILCDARVSWSLYPASAAPLTRITLFLGGADGAAVALFPLQGDLVRIIVAQPVSEARDFASDPTLDEFQDIWDRRAPGTGRLHDPVWLARFRLHHRGVASYRAGRLFVAGDAAHIHSPAGGQGMNTGIQDAVNLGWKLARVLQSRGGGGVDGAGDGEGDDNDDQTAIHQRLLDSYHAERYPVGRKLLTGTDRLFSYVASTGFFFILFRNLFVTWVMPYLVRSRARRAQLFGFISELRIRYRRSPLVGAAPGCAAGSLRAGDRAPDGMVVELPGGTEERWLMELCHADNHALLLFTGAGASTGAGDDYGASNANLFAETLAAVDLADTQIFTVARARQSTGAAGATTEEAVVGSSRATALLDVDGKLHKTYGFEEPAWVLVRPDGHIAYMGRQSSLNEWTAWMREHY